MALGEQRDSEITSNPSDDTALTDKTLAIKNEQIGGGGKSARIPTIGDSIGKYELKEKLGSGGMSVVFKAYDAALSRMVAIKLLLSHGDNNPIDIMRFQQEAKAASRLEHPNIVKVHDFSITDDGVPYLVMSYLEGISLSDTIKAEGGLSLGRWLSVMIQACDALAHAHQNNVVHRDIKPSNFVLSNENGAEVLKLVDFGIAKIESNDEQALTKTGEVFGSPLYMSPEQCSGSRVDARSDVYSLGCVMYEALSGKPPLSGDNALATIVKHLQEKPIPLQTVCPKIKDVKSVDNVVLKCLEKKPEDRFADTVAVRKELERLFLGLGVRAKSQNRKTIFAFIAVVIIVVISIISYNTIERNIQESKIAAEQTEMVARRQKCTDTHLEGRRLLAEKNYKQASVKLEEALNLAMELKTRPIVQASMALELAVSELNLQNRSKAEDLFKQVVDWKFPVENYDSQGLKYHAYTYLANESKYNFWRLEEAKAYYLKALAIAEKLNSKNHLCSTLLELGTTSSELNQKEEAEAYLKRALHLKATSSEVIMQLEKLYQRTGNAKKQKDFKTSLESLKNRIAEEKRRKQEIKKKLKLKEDESDRQSNLKTEKLKKDWSDAILPPNNKDMH